MRATFLAGPMLALAACGQSAAPPAETAPAESTQMQVPENHLTCADFSGVTLASLQERFGAENIVEQTLPGAEGEGYTATVVYPNDATRRLEVVWAAQAAHTRAQTILVTGDENTWVGPSGVEIGEQLTEVEEGNGRAFELSGFGWDYGGSVTDWRNGNLDQAGCHVMVRFTAEGDTPDAITGDRLLSSDLPEMHAANPRVYQFGLTFPAE